MWKRVAFGSVLLSAAAASPPIARLFLRISPQRVVQCEVVYRHHQYANVRLEDGRLVSLESGDVGLPVACPPIGSMLSKARWKWRYSIAGTSERHLQSPDM
jgi:hypothetical protein